MNNYSFNVFWSQEDEAYIATCPEFPRISAFGETAEDAMSELRTALEMAIETYQEEGWPLPVPRTQPEYSGQFRVRMPKSLHARLASQAETEGVSLNTLVVTYLSAKAGASSGPSKLDGKAEEPASKQRSARRRRSA